MNARRKESSAYVPQWYTSPLKLKERECGKARISHRIIPKGENVSIVGTRQAILRGMRPVSGTVQEPLRVHELSHADHGLWMTDLPEELNQIGELMYTVRPCGRVLVGGLGLGILAHAVSQCADEVVVIERDSDVISLCSRRGYTVIEADIGEYLRTSTERFDFYLLDTWQGTNEGTWWSKVLPLRRAIRQKWGRKPVVHCWAEDIMQGQIFRSLVTKPPHWYYTGLPMPMSQPDARRFLSNVGLPAWERAYGPAVDKALSEKGN